MDYDMAVIELDPQNILATPNQIDWIERVNNSVDYYSGTQKHNIMYGSEAAAEVAIDAWRDMVGVFTPLLALMDGDIVDVERTGDKRSAKNTAKFRSAPTIGIPYWVFESIQTPGLLTYVFEEITVIKRV